MPQPIIGFSELISPVDNEGIQYHVEWLTDEHSFPSLSPPSSIKDIHPSDTDWQLVEENEIDQVEYTLLHGVTDCLDDEAEFWQLLHHIPQQHTYAKLAIDAQDQLVGSSPLYPFSPIHPHSVGKNKNSTTIKKADDEIDFYHLYEARKSHGSHSYFGNKNYFERKKIIAYREFWDYWGCSRPEVTPRYLHQCVAMQSHAKQYKPPGPRNANKNKKDRNLKSQSRLEL
jgi:hypothetical protein